MPQQPRRACKKQKQNTFSIGGGALDQISKLGHWQKDELFYLSSERLSLAEISAIFTPRHFAKFCYLVI